MKLSDEFINSQSQGIDFFLNLIIYFKGELSPQNDDFLRLRREELWIRRYQSIEFGANKHS